MVGWFVFLFFKKTRRFPLTWGLCLQCNSVFQTELSLSEEVMDPKHPAGLRAKGAGMLMALDVESTSEHRISAGTAPFDLYAGKRPLVVYLRFSWNVNFAFAALC